MDAERIATIRDRIYRGKHSHINELCDALVASQAENTKRHLALMQSMRDASELLEERDALQAENAELQTENDHWGRTIQAGIDAQEQRWVKLVRELQAENTRLNNVVLKTREVARRLIKERDRLASQVTDLTAWIRSRFIDRDELVEDSDGAFAYAAFRSCQKDARALLARLTPTEEPPT